MSELILDQDRVAGDVDDVREAFWPKVKSVLGRVPFVKDAVALYYALLDPDTPFWVKGMVATTLLYFISPMDAVPDILTAAGYTDDATILYVTLQLVADHVTGRHHRMAADALGTEYVEPALDDVLIEEPATGGADMAATTDDEDLDPFVDDDRDTSVS